MKDRFYAWLSQRMPKKLLYHAIITSWAKVTTEKYTERTHDSITWDEVCKFLDEGK